MVFSIKKLSAVLAASVALTGAVPAGNKDAPLYKDPKQPISARVDDLLKRMTIEDKTAQLIQGDIASWLNETDHSFNYTGLVDSMKTRSGSIFTGRFVPWELITDMTKRGQDYLLENTSVPIPAFLQSEGVHGFEVENGTVFNSAIGYSASWNRDLIEKMAAVVGREARAVGTNQVFAPVIDLTLDPRYGRVEEALGEDAWLAAELGYHYVVGLQSEKVSATVKHFFAYGAGEQGLNLAPRHGGEREARMKYFPAFKKPIIEGQAHSIMSAYNSYDGVPAIANHHALVDVLRDEWGYEGYVISDGGASDRPCQIFQMCSADPFDKETTTKLMLENGNDVEMGGGHYSFEVIPEMVKSGKLDEKYVDRAVRHILHAKFQAGLFEEPFIGVTDGKFEELIHTPENVKIARQLDAESIVLLENHNNTLPLKKESKIAVIGPFAGHMNYGDYVIPNTIVRGVNPYEGIKNAVGSKGKVEYALGCEAWSNDRSKFKEAVALANNSDVAVVVVGTWSADQFLLWNNGNVTTGEGADQDDLSLVGPQADLIKAIKKTGVPTVVVFSSGKPITEPWLSDEVDALVQHFYPGEQGGNALADVLFGAHNPSGRLTVSFPRFVGDLPVIYDHLKSARQTNKAGQVFKNGTMDFGRSYVFGSPYPWYEFGYGLSYSEFEYGNVSLSTRNVSKCQNETIYASVNVTNKGPYPGQEVVQLYVVDEIATVDIPNKSLRGFEKIHLDCNETKEVKIPIKLTDLALWSMKNQYVVEAGDFRVEIGKSATNIMTNATFNVAKDEVVKI